MHAVRKEGRRENIYQSLSQTRSVRGGSEGERESFALRNRSAETKAGFLPIVQIRPRKT